MRKSMLFVFLSLLVTSMMWAEDGYWLWGTTEEGFEASYVEISEDEKNCMLVSCREIEGSVTNPSEVDLFAVIGIGNYTFDRHTGLNRFPFLIL